MSNQHINWLEWDDKVPRIQHSNTDLKVIKVKSVPSIPSLVPAQQAVGFVLQGIRMAPSPHAHTRHAQRFHSAGKNNHSVKWKMQQSQQVSGDIAAFPPFILLLFPSAFIHLFSGALTFTATLGCVTTRQQPSFCPYTHGQDMRIHGLNVICPPKRILKYSLQG